MHAQISSLFPPKHLYTVTVGRNRSKARYALTTSSDVADMLEALVQQVGEINTHFCGRMELRRSKCAHLAVITALLHACGAACFFVVAIPVLKTCSRTSSAKCSQMLQPPHIQPHIRTT